VLGSSFLLLWVYNAQRMLLVSFDKMSGTAPDNELLTGGSILGHSQDSDEVKTQFVGIWTY
jgi:hypothetical protein